MTTFTIAVMPSNEPKSAAAVKRWIEKHTRSSDRFAYVADKYEPHRKEHGCYDVYPFDNGPLLGALAAAAKRRTTRFSKLVLRPVRSRHSGTRENGRISSAYS